MTLNRRLCLSTLPNPALEGRKRTTEDVIKPSQWPPSVPTLHTNHLIHLTVKHLWTYTYDKSAVYKSNIMVIINILEEKVQTGHPYSKRFFCTLLVILQRNQLAHTSNPLDHSSTYPLCRWIRRAIFIIRSKKCSKCIRVDDILFCTFKPIFNLCGFIVSCLYSFSLKFFQSFLFRMHSFLFVDFPCL